MGSRWVKTAEKTRAPSPKSNFGKRGGPWSENNTKMNKSRLLFIRFTITEKIVGGFHDDFEFLFDISYW